MLRHLAPEQPVELEHGEPVLFAEPLERRVGTAPSAAVGIPESGAAPPLAWPSAAVVASSGYSMTGRAHTRGTHSRSHAASSSGMSHASRLRSVQRTCSIGNPASSHSARRYGVYEVEMM